MILPHTLKKQLEVLKREQIEIEQETQINGIVEKYNRTFAKIAQHGGIDNDKFIKESSNILKQSGESFIYTVLDNIDIFLPYIENLFKCYNKLQFEQKFNNLKDKE